MNDKDELMIANILSIEQRQIKCQEEVEVVCRKYNCIMITDEFRRGGVTMKMETNYVAKENIQNFVTGKTLIT